MEGRKQVIEYFKFVSVEAFPQWECLNTNINNKYRIVDLINRGLKYA